MQLRELVPSEINELIKRNCEVFWDLSQIKVQLTASAEFGVGDAVEVVVAEAELEDPRLLQLDGDVGHGDAVADHGAVFGS